MMSLFKRRSSIRRSGRGSMFRGWFGLFEDGPGVKTTWAAQQAAVRPSIHPRSIPNTTCWNTWPFIGIGKPPTFDWPRSHYTFFHSLLNSVKRGFFFFFITFDEVMYYVVARGKGRKTRVKSLEWMDARLIWILKLLGDLIVWERNKVKLGWSIILFFT